MNKMKKDEEGFVLCQICGRKFRQITSFHLKKHKVTVKEYRDKFPEAEITCKELRKLHSETFYEYLKEHPDHQSRASLVAHKVLKEKGAGCYDPRVQRLGGLAVKEQKKAIFAYSHEELCKLGHKAGKIGGPRGGKVTYERYGSEHFANIGKIGGKIGGKVLSKKYSHEHFVQLGKRGLHGLINHRNIFFENKKFLSKMELSCYKILRTLFDNNEVDVNKNVGNYHIDFYILPLDIFIEFHPIVYVDNGIKRSIRSINKDELDRYFIDRYEIIKKNGFGSSQLLVFAKIKDLKDWVQKIDLVRVRREM